MNMNWNEITRFEDLLHRLIIPFLLKVVGAFAIWILASLVIRWAKRLLGRTLLTRKVDPTLVLYANQTLGLALRALAIAAILNLFGIETTSFSAILAAAGVAIGVAWSGLLSNFAAGIFLILFRPFKSGDTISAAGVSGVVREIGLFATLIDNADHQRIFVGNNKLFSDNIVNSSTHAWRLATFRVELAHTADAESALTELPTILASVPGVRSDPAVSAEILEIHPIGMTLQLKAACPPSEHARILADGNRALYQGIRLKGYPLPEPLRLSINRQERA
jgi:small conductance mechanosensitive channel